MQVDTRVKIVLLLASSISLFASSGILGVSLWALALLLVLRACRVSFDEVLHGTRPALAILVLTTLFNAFVLDGSGTVPLIGVVGISYAGALRAAAAVSRILLLVGLALSFAASTTAEELVDAVIRLLRPFEVLSLDVQAAALALALALGFFPLVSYELAAIRSAQESRGAAFSEGPLFDRLRVWVSVFTPLLVALFRRADRLSVSMESRCYREDRPHVVAPASLGARDRFVLVFGLATIAVIVVASRLVG